MDENKLPYPTKLSKGYLLANRIISVHYGFLNITYEQYSKLDSISPEEDLYPNILDPDPFLEMYSCEINRRYYEEINSSHIQEINRIIEEGKLDTECKSLLTKSGEVPFNKTKWFREFVNWTLAGLWFLILFFGFFFLFKHRKTQKKIYLKLSWLFLLIIIFSSIYFLYFALFKSIY
jgi:hypothetical protein